MIVQSEIKQLHETTIGDLIIRMTLFRIMRHISVKISQKLWNYRNFKLTQL